MTKFISLAKLTILLGRFLSTSSGYPIPSYVLSTTVLFKPVRFIRVDPYSCFQLINTYFPKLSRYLYDHKAIKLAAKYHKFEIKQFLCIFIFIFIGQILPRTKLTTEYVVKHVMVFKAVSPSCFHDQ